MQVRYLDEFKWVDAADGTIFQFQDDSGESVADVAVHDPDLNLWKWEVRVPPRYRYRDVQPCGLIVGVLPASFSGKWTVNVDPTPGRLSTVT